MLRSVWGGGAVERVSGGLGVVMVYVGGGGAGGCTVLVGEARMVGVEMFSRIQLTIYHY